MPDTIRTVQPHETEQFERFLERCYGHRRGFFGIYAPDIFVDVEGMARYCIILESAGEIVSHVGAYPMEIVVGPARVLAGGVGGVATIPEARGKGYMSKLLDESLQRMRNAGWSLSVLWGDRQRYGSFGWETCGMGYRLHITRRAMEWAKVPPANVTEADPRDPAVVEYVRGLHAGLQYRLERPRFALQLRRRNVRIFTAPEGFLLTTSDTPGDISVLEMASPAGKEASIILGTLIRCFGNAASVELSPGDTDRLDRLSQVMSHWSIAPQGMFRIINWPGLLRSLQPLLTLKAQGLPPFESCVGCQWGDEIEWATAIWDGRELAIEEKRRGEGVAVELRKLTALVLGGPQQGREALGGLGWLLPVPLHIPSLDHV
jgi:GNAT superfamily N-acetyltransferase